MGIIYYDRGCGSCAGNQSIQKIKKFCEKEGVEFQEHRTILWKVYENEANEIIELNEGLELPFFYGESTGLVLESSTFSLTDDLKKLVKEEKKASRECQLPPS